MPLPALAIAGGKALLSGAVGSGLKRLFGGGKKKKKPAAPSGPPDPLGDDALRTQFASALSGGKMPGDEQRTEARSRMMNFDADEAVGTSARGAYDLMKPQLDEDIATYREGQVGLGRLRSGFATEGEDRILTDSLNNLNARVASNALQAQGLNLSNTRMLADSGQTEREDQLALITGQMDRNTAMGNADRDANAQRSAQRWGAAGKIGGTIAAKVPWGKVGSWAAKGIGKLFS